MKNETDCQLGFYLQGPSTRNFAVEKGTSETLDVAAGSYKFGVDNHLCPGKLLPQSGNDIFAAGGSYTLTLSEQVIQPKTGQFEIHNDTGASLTVKVGGATRTVATGSVSIALPVGSYTADITAKCGTTTESFKITQGETYTGKYWCVGGRVTTENRAVGMGNFVVNNNTGGTLTVSVGGKTHKVPQGTTSINLPEGKYKANIVSRCGSATESLNIEAGSQHEGHYQCVSYRVR